MKKSLLLCLLLVGTCQGHGISFDLHRNSTTDTQPKASPATESDNSTTHPSSASSSPADIPVSRLVMTESSSSQDYGRALAVDEESGGDLIRDALEKILSISQRRDNESEGADADLDQQGQENKTESSVPRADAYSSALAREKKVNSTKKASLKDSQISKPNARSDNKKAELKNASDGLKANTKSAQANSSNSTSGGSDSKTKPGGTECANKTLAELAKDEECAKKTLAELAKDDEIAKKTLAELAKDAGCAKKTLAELARNEECARKTLAEVAKDGGCDHNKTLELHNGAPLREDGKEGSSTLKSDKPIASVVAERRKQLNESEPATTKNLNFSDSSTKASTPSKTTAAMDHRMTTSQNSTTAITTKRNEAATTKHHQVNVTTYSSNFAANAGQVRAEVFSGDNQKDSKHQSQTSPDDDATVGHLTSHSHGEPKKLIFCYYSSSASGRPSLGKFWPENIDPFLCTHVIFAFADITKNGKGIKQNNWNDLGEKGLYARTLKLKEKNPKLKVLLAVGGWKIGSKPFIPLMESETYQDFADNVVAYLRKYKFDGMDMDWEFPGTRGSKPEDKFKFTKLMKAIYETFAEESKESGKEKLLLTLATASSDFYVQQSYEAQEIHKYIDYMLLMTYNYHGSGWEMTTGHHSPVLPHRKDPPGDQRELYLLWSIDYWLNKGVPKKKLIVGLPTYGMGWKLTAPKNHGIRVSTEGGNEKGKYSGESGILALYEICEKIIHNNWKVEWIMDQRVPYAHGEGDWIGFDSPDSTSLKAKIILKLDLAGAFLWSVEMDDFSGHCGGPKYPIIRTVYNLFTGITKAGIASVGSIKVKKGHPGESHGNYGFEKGSSSSSSSSSSSGKKHRSSESKGSHKGRRGKTSTSRGAKSQSKTKSSGGEGSGSTGESSSHWSSSSHGSSGSSGDHGTSGSSSSHGSSGSSGDHGSSGSSSSHGSSGSSDWSSSSHGSSRSSGGHGSDWSSGSSGEHGSSGSSSSHGSSGSSGDHGSKWSSSSHGSSGSSGWSSSSHGSSGSSGDHGSDWSSSSHGSSGSSGDHGSEWSSGSSGDHGSSNSHGSSGSSGDHGSDWSSSSHDSSGSSGDHGSDWSSSSHGSSGSAGDHGSDWSSGTSGDHGSSGSSSSHGSSGSSGDHGSSSHWSSESSSDHGSDWSSSSHSSSGSSGDHGSDWSSSSHGSSGSSGDHGSDWSSVTSGDHGSSGSLSSHGSSGSSGDHGSSSHGSSGSSSDHGSDWSSGSSGGHGSSGSSSSHGSTGSSDDHDGDDSSWSYGGYHGGGGNDEDDENGGDWGSDKWWEDHSWVEKGSWDYYKQPEEGDLDCEKYGLGIWGDEDSCVHFTLCVPAYHGGLRALRMKCPEGTKFDWKLKVCNHAHKVDC